MRSALACLLLGTTLVTSAFGQGRNPGSVLIYPVHRSGPNWFTVVSVTNTNLTPSNPNSFGGSTNVHFQYVNVTAGANPFRPVNCTVFDRIEFLTPADTLSVLTTCHNATQGTQEGFLIVDAEDPSLNRTPFSHNDLLGSELVVTGSGVAYSVEAVSLASPVRQGGRTDLNNNRRLDFDGAEYAQLPDLLYIDSFIALAGSQLSLMNLTGGHQDINTVYFSVWNDNEFPLSTTLEFNCWFDQPLSRISSLFTHAFLISTRHDPRELDITCDGVGDLETGWAILDSIDVRLPGGGTISPDGAMLGAITSGLSTLIDGGRLLGESRDTQNNGSFGY